MVITYCCTYPPILWAVSVKFNFSYCICLLSEIRFLISWAIISVTVYFVHQYMIFSFKFWYKTFTWTIMIICFFLRLFIWKLIELKTDSLVDRMINVITLSSIQMYFLIDNYFNGIILFLRKHISHPIVSWTNCTRKYIYWNTKLN